MKKSDLIRDVTTALEIEFQHFLQNYSFESYERFYITTIKSQIQRNSDIIRILKEKLPDDINDD